jgi:hypothetical protein
MAGRRDNSALFRAWVGGASVLLAVSGSVTSAAGEAPFAFESVTALDDMSSLIQSRFPLGTSRDILRHVFVEEGHGTLKTRADVPGIEKYLYDIDLCHYYVWRWNISADYDASGQLRQAYVNGNIVFADGHPKKIVSMAPEEGKKSAVYRIQRPRPEAYKGENSLAAILLDRDGNLATTDDQILVGAGPSRADPANMGKMIAYTEVDPWRSIFDADSADRIATYRGSCEAADKLYDAQKQALKR